MPALSSALAAAHVCKAAASVMKALPALAVRLPRPSVLLTALATENVSTPSVSVRADTEASTVPMSFSTIPWPLRLLTPTRVPINVLEEGCVVEAASATAPPDGLVSTVPSTPTCARTSVLAMESVHRTSSAPALPALEGTPVRSSSRQLALETAPVSANVPLVDPFPSLRELLLVAVTSQTTGAAKNVTKFSRPNTVLTTVLAMASA